MTTTTTTTTTPAPAPQAEPMSFEQAVEGFGAAVGAIDERLGPDGWPLVEALFLRVLDLMTATRRNTPGYTGPQS